MADSPSELHAEIEKLERKHAEHPEGRYFVPLANAYRKLGDVEHAENLLRDGLRRHPDYLSAHIVLGRCLADRSATREASDEFRYVLSFDPQNLIALRTLGELAAAEGRSAEAERWYEELLAVDPMNDEARRALESLRGAAAVPEVEEEFRPDAAWWEREPELEEEPVTAQEPEMRHEPGAAQEPEAAAVDDSPAWSEPPDEEPVADRPDEEETAGNLFGGSEGSDPEEVVTETIAELYARQGFHERAAGVYRELIRRRGGDPVLERRLAEMESRMGGAEPTLPPPEPTPEPESEPELPALQDTFATSFADGFFAADEERDDEPDMTEQPPEPEPVLEPESIAEPEPIPAPAPAAASERETIGSYLRALIAWTPGAEESVEFSPVEEAPSSPEAELEPEPEREPEPWPEPEEAADLQPVQPQRLAEEPESEPAPGPAAPEEPGTGRAEADLFPWELPMDSAPRTTWVRTPEPESRPEPAPLQPHEEEDFFSFDAFFSDEPSGGAPGKGATPAPEAKPEPAAEEDDDLESFQAWLRSLKR